MELVIFLSRVLANKGYKVLAQINPNNVVYHYHYNSIADLSSAITKKSSTNANIYYALSTFSESSLVERTNKNTGKTYKVIERTQKNASWQKSFWLDIDCGSNKDYETREAGKKAIMQFIVNTGLPKPSMIVNSGGGFHIYWCMDNEITTEQWRPVSIKLANACMVAGFKVDTTCTCDSARILRPIGTINKKYNVPVELLFNGSNIIYSDFVSKLDSYLAKHPNELQALEKRNYKEFKKDDDVIFDAKSIFDNSSLFKWALNNPTKLSEPAWRGILSILRFCENGIELSHKFSSLDKERYDYETTQKKLDYLIEKDIGPYTYNALELAFGFQEDNHSKLNLNSSPLFLGKKYKNIENKSDDDLPEPPYPYARTKKGLVILSKSSDDEADREELLFEGDIVPVPNIFENQSGDTTAVFKVSIADREPKILSIPMKDWYSNDKLKSYLGNIGISLSETAIKKVLIYMRSYTNLLQKQAKVIRQVNHFGWLDKNHNKFLLGSDLYTTKGIQKSIPTAETTSLSKYFHTSGTFEKWKEVMDFLNDNNLIEQQFCVLTSFASVLMDFTDYDSLWFHMINKTGVGKTTTQHMILSVWGEPKPLLMLNKDTDNMKESRFGLLHSLPACIDEITNVNGEALSDLILGATQGRGRGRLSGATMTEREMDKVWKLLIISSGNNSLIEKVNPTKGDPTAEITRTIEIDLPHSDNMYRDGMNKITRPISENYGWAGKIFLSKLIQITDKIKPLLDNANEKICQNIKVRSQDRFWLNGMSAILTSAILVKQWGIMNIDLNKIYAMIIKILMKAQRTLSSYQITAAELISDYLARNIRNTFIINKNNNIVIQEPFNNLLIRSEWDPVGKNGVLYIGKNDFNTFCNERGVSSKLMLDELSNSGLLYKAGELISLGKGSRYSVGRKWCIGINIETLSNDIISNHIERNIKV